MHLTNFESKPSSEITEAIKAIGLIKPERWLHLRFNLRVLIPSQALLLVICQVFLETHVSHLIYYSLHSNLYFLVWRLLQTMVLLNYL